MAERVVVVDDGQVIADDTAAALKRDLAGDRLVLHVQAGPGSREAAARVAELVSHLPTARAVVIEGERVEARVADGAAAVPLVVRAAIDATILLAGATAFAPTLDDVFLNLTGRSLRESSAETSAGPPTSTTDGDHRVARKDAA